MMLDNKFLKYKLIVLLIINGWFVTNMIIVDYMAMTYVISHYIDGDLWVLLLFSLALGMSVETIIRIQLLDL